MRFGRCRLVHPVLIPKQLGLAVNLYPNPTARLKFTPVIQVTGWENRSRQILTWSSGSPQMDVGLGADAGYDTTCRTQGLGLGLGLWHAVWIALSTHAVWIRRATPVGA